MQFALIAHVFLKANIRFYRSFRILVIQRIRRWRLRCKHGLLFMCLACFYKACLVRFLKLAMKLQTKQIFLCKREKLIQGVPNNINTSVSYYFTLDKLCRKSEDLASFLFKTILDHIRYFQSGIFWALTVSAAPGAVQLSLIPNSEEFSLLFVVSWFWVWNVSYYRGGDKSCTDEEVNTAYFANLGRTPSVIGPKP